MAAAPEKAFEIIERNKKTSFKSHVPEDAASDEMITFCDRLDEEGKTARNLWGKRWDDDVTLWRGNVSKGADSAPPKHFAADILTSAIQRRVSLLAEAKPIFDVTPRRAKLDASAEIFKIASMGVMDSQQWGLSVEVLLTLASIMGSAGIRTRWQKDPYFGFGEITINAVDSRNVRLDPAVTRSWEINYGQYTIIESVQPLGIMRWRHPDMAHRIKATPLVSRDMPGKQQEIWNLRQMSRGSQQEGNEATPRVLVREYFVYDPAQDENGSPKYPNGRYLIRCGDELIVNPDDDQNPYFDGMSDLDMFDSSLDPDHPWGRSELEALRAIQRAFDDSGDLLVRSFLRNGYPWVIADRNALDTDTLQRLRDREQMVLEKQGGRDVTRVPGVIPGSDAISLMQMLMGLVNQNTGLTDPGMEGKGRVELRSGAQVEGLQSAAQILVRAAARRLEQLMERMGQKIISRIIQFYDDDRLITYYGGDDTFVKYQFERKQLIAQIIAYGIQRALKDRPKDEEGNLTVDQMADSMLLSIKQAWRDFQFKIVPYSSLSSVKTQRAMLKLQLAQAGLLPNADALGEIGIENAKEKVQEAAQEQMFRQAIGFPPPGPAKKKGK